MTGVARGFPVWLRATHWINVLFIRWVVRAGIKFLGAYPRLSSNDHTTPGADWLTRTTTPILAERPWIAPEQEKDVPSWLGQPRPREQLAILRGDFLDLERAGAYDLALRR